MNMIVIKSANHPDYPKLRFFRSNKVVQRVEISAVIKIINGISSIIDADTQKVDVEECLKIVRFISGLSSTSCSPSLLSIEITLIIKLLRHHYDTVDII